MEANETNKQGSSNTKSYNMNITKTPRDRFEDSIGKLSITWQEVNCEHIIKDARNAFMEYERMLGEEHKRFSDYKSETKSRIKDLLALIERNNEADEACWMSQFKLEKAMQNKIKELKADNKRLEKVYKVCQKERKEWKNKACKLDKKQNER